MNNAQQAKLESTLVEARGDTNVCPCLCRSLVLSCFARVCFWLCVLSVRVFSGVGNVLFSNCSQTLHEQDQMVVSGASDNSAWVILGKRKIDDEK